MEKIVRQFIPDALLISNELLAGGLIHQTRKVHIHKAGVSHRFILQKLNTDTFKDPLAVMKNLHRVNDVLRKTSPLITPEVIKTPAGDSLFHDSTGSYWRMFSCVENSISYDAPPGIDHVRKAGRTYGTFLTALRDIDPDRLKITIPDFHNLDQRYTALRKQATSAAPERIRRSAAVFDQIYQYHENYSFDFSAHPLRAVHNDSKLSNLLFDKTTDECVAVIDLDTVMPGYVVTDFGDMVRGMCSTATEEERNLERVAFRSDYFDALTGGFLESTQDWLHTAEKDHLLIGAIYIILEQAIRFLDDYLDGDHYYHAAYPEHNFNRAANQLTLLTSMLENVHTR